MNLIINADDFGLTSDTNAAIIELAQLGTISSTSVMVNMPYAKEIIEIIPYKNCGIGLHLNLTQGKPISDPHSISSLISNKGIFYPVSTLRSKIRSGEVKSEHIKLELEAQYYLLQKLIGKKPDHIDSHQDINKLKQVSELLCQFATKLEKRIGLRVYNKCYLIKKSPQKIVYPSFLNMHLFGIKRVLVETVFRSRMKTLSNHFDIPDGMLFTQGNSTRDLLNIIHSIDVSQKGNNTYEIMCHPAKSVDQLTDTKMMESRVAEFEILRSEKFISFINRTKLVNFSQLSAH